MATSGVTTYTRNAEQIVRVAFRHCGMRQASITSDDIAVALEALNLLVIKLRNEGVWLWKVTDVVVPLVAAQATYTLSSPKPLRIISARRRNLTSLFETDMNKWSVQEYNSQSVKNTTGGEPLSYTYQELRDSVRLSIWPVPTTSAATNYSVVISAHLPIEIFSSEGNDFDFPPECYLPLGWMLAEELMCDFDVPYNRMQIIKTKSTEAKNDMVAMHEEDSSVYFSLDYTGAR